MNINPFCCCWGADLNRIYCVVLLLMCCVVVAQVLEIWYLGKAFIGCIHSVFLAWEGAAVAFVFGRQFVFSFLLPMGISCLHLSYVLGGDLRLFFYLSRLFF